MGDWFSELVGFRETSWADTRQRLEVAGTTLRSTFNGRTFGIGTLEILSVAELRARAAACVNQLRGTASVTTVVGEAGALHRDAANAGALFQVASQFNLLEMTSPKVTPEDGVARYQDDRTQGPACAIAAGAATIYRNYFVPVGAGLGQTRERQIDCLSAISDALGNRTNELWSMRNGYALCSTMGMERINAALEDLDSVGRDALRDLLRIGVQWDVEVTSAASSGLHVSQAFCSALPLGMYADVRPDLAAPFATLILEGAYEATLWAAVINAARTGNRTVFLTMVGGGVFGNDHAWIRSAIARTLHLIETTSLDVRLVSQG